MAEIRDEVDRVEILKNLRRKVNWKCKLERSEFLSELEPLITHWAGPLPELRDIFRPKEIDWILSQSNSFAVTFAEFAISTGYKDEPEIGEDGKPSLRRSTPLHQAATEMVRFEASEIRRLFRIYNRFDMNYIDKNGVTHFHVACTWRIFEVIEEFLEHGQDPNVLEPRNRNSPLHLALYNFASSEVILLLLRKGADLRLVNAEGSTPLHIFCGKYNDFDLAQLLFDLSYENHQLPPVDVRDMWGKTPLHLALEHRCKNTTEALLKNGADPNLADAEGFTPLHKICRYWLDSYELAEMLFRISAEKNQLVSLNALTKSGQTPLHIALSRDTLRRDLVLLLLRKGADLRLVNAEGLTPLHIFCKKYDDVDLAMLLLDLNNEKHQLAQVDVQDNLGNAPLHLALEHRHRNVAEFLLRNGADPNLANAKGFTPLHKICRYWPDGYEPAEMLFRISAEKNQLVSLNASTKSGQTPLHLALLFGRRNLFQLLLTNGADPNLADTEGLTALHFVTKRFECTDFAELFFKIIDEKRQSVRIDARDKLGQTPLHLAVYYKNESAIEALLRRGANPNLTTEEKLTPLHIICQNYKIRRENKSRQEDLAKLFFKICQEVNRVVRVDAKDKQGRTPLQIAVANFKPDMVEVLLDNDADLSGLVLADTFYFVSKLNMSPDRWISFAVSFASGALTIVDCLEKKGYELDLTDAIMIMKMFGLYGLFEKSVDLEKSWCDDEKFASKAKDIKIIPSLSLYDFIQLQPREAARQLTYQDYFNFARSNKMGELPEGSIETCARHLCEKLTRRFFQRWAVHSFMELTRCRLPILCVDMIIEQLTNKDLLRICSANKKK
uniref:Uncharacterized protein n=1 Tax=Trichogramma kaykai TaxID=54128 RepID=A0ABD2WG00_9HYME